eukprot:372245_1
MGTEQSTTFAYCGTGGYSPQYDNIDKNVQNLNSQTINVDPLTKNKDQTEALETQLRDARHQIKEMFERYAVIKQETETRYALLAEQYQRECDQKTKLMSQIQNSKKRYDELIKLINEKHARELHRCTKLHKETLITPQINALEQSHQRLQQQQMVDKHRLLSLQKANKRIIKRNKDLQNEIAQNNRPGDATVFTEIIDLKDENKSLKKQIDTMRGEMTALETEHAQAHASAGYEDGEGDVIDITEQLLQSRQKEQIAKLEKELEDARKEMNALIESNKGSNTNYTTLTKQYQKECEQSSVFMNQIQNSRTRYVELMNTQKVLNDEYERVIEKYRSSNIKLQNEMNEYVQYKQRNAELEHEISKLNRIITEYKANDETNISIIELRHEINEKEDHIKRLQNKLDMRDDHDADEAEEFVNSVALSQLMSIETSTNTSDVTPHFVTNMTTPMCTPICVQTPQSICTSENITAYGFPEQRHNMRHAKSVGDVAEFVREKYGSGSRRNSSRITDVEYDESDESSYSEHEAIEIAKRKDIAEETEAMKQAILNMKQSMSKEMKKELRMQQHSMKALIDVESTSDGDEYERLPDNLGPNLFRDQSEMNWDSQRLAEQNKSMSQQMIFLLQSQSKTNIIAVTSPKDDVM